MILNEQPSAVVESAESAAAVETQPVAPGDVDNFIRALRQSKKELETARQQFETVVDPLLIDHIVFRLGAAERHFNYLFQLARRWNISVDGVRFDWKEDD